MENISDHLSWGSDEQLCTRQVSYCTLHKKSKDRKLWSIWLTDSGARGYGGAPWWRKTSGKHSRSCFASMPQGGNCSGCLLANTVQVLCQERRTCSFLLEKLSGEDKTLLEKLLWLKALVSNGQVCSCTLMTCNSSNTCVSDSSKDTTNLSFKGRPGYFPHFMTNAFEAKYRGGWEYWELRAVSAMPSKKSLCQVDYLLNWTFEEKKIFWERKHYYQVCTVCRAFTVIYTHFFQSVLNHCLNLWQCFTSLNRLLEGEISLGKEQSKPLQCIAQTATRWRS